MEKTEKSEKLDKAGVPRGKRPRVQVSLDEKERAIARIRNGETKAGISRELGVPESTVRGWVKRAEQRLARTVANESEDVASSESKAIPKSPLPAAAAAKRDHEGQVRRMAASAPLLTATAAHPEPQSMPLPFQILNRAVQQQDVEMHVLSWLLVFNAGLLNFTMIANAAYMHECALGSPNRFTLWEMITNFVDEVGQHPLSLQDTLESPESHPLPSTETTTTTTSKSRNNNSFVHITAEDDDS